MSKEVYTINLPPKDPAKIRSGVRPGKIIQDKKTKATTSRKKKHKKGYSQETE